MDDQPRRFPPDELRAGVVPAAPGWRVVLTDGKRAFVAPVVLWSWSKRVFREDGDERIEYPEDGVDASALIAWEGSLSDADDVAKLYMSNASAGEVWQVHMLLAPGQQLVEGATDALEGGWEEVDVARVPRMHAEPKLYLASTQKDVP